MPIGFSRDTGRDEILLTKRTMLVETHKGQISFPGGMREGHDLTLLDTALRESAEEIGTLASDIEVLGPLPPVLTRGDVVIYPWVGRLGFPYSFKINQHEVEKVLYLPLVRLIEEGLAPVEVEIGPMKVKSIGITVDKELVWGATAKILDQLRDCFKSFAPER